MSEKKKRAPGCGSLFVVIVGLFEMLAVAIAVLALFVAIRYPSQVINLIWPEYASMPTTTPIVIVATVPAPTPPPTYTPYPTATPYPTYTPYPQPTLSPTPKPILVSLPFEDNFDMEPRPEWEPIRGTWRVVDGKYTADPSKDWSMTFVGDIGWTDYAVDVDVLSRNRQYPVRIIVRAQDGSYMVLEATGGKTDWIMVSEGSSRVIAHSDKPGLTHGWRTWQQNHLRIEVKGNIYTAYSDGTRLLQVQDTSFASGRVGLAFQYATEDTTRFDDFRITELR